jgi:hypothetical protein
MLPFTNTQVLVSESRWACTHALNGSRFDILRGTKHGDDVGRPEAMPSNCGSIEEKLAAPNGKNEHP